jgi:hypothetical protein
VTLHPGLWRAPGTLQRGEQPERVHHPARGLVDADAPWAEMALVHVTNIGRTPTSVSDIGLDLGRARWWRPWRRTTITGRPIAVAEGVAAGPVVRLEPGEQVAVFLAMWAPADLRRYADGRVTVRATARPAGHRAELSPRRDRWKARTDRDAWWMPSPGPNARAFQEFFAAYAPHDPDGVYDRWLEVQQAMARVPPDVGSVRELLVPAAGIIRAIATADRIERLVHRTSALDVRLEL